MGKKLKMKKIIPTYMQREITTYLNYSMPLCTFLKPDKNQWLLEHFTNIYLMMGTDGYVWVDYLEDLLFPHNVIDYIMIEAGEMEKIVDMEPYLLNLVDENFCLMFFIDEFDVGGTAYYRKSHRITQILVYGYDQEKREIYVVGFDKTRKFTELVYDYQDVLSSYNKCLRNRKGRPFWEDKYNVILLRDKDPEMVYKADPNVVYDQIKKFFYSEGSVEDLRPEIRIERGEIAYYGMRAQEELINNFQKLYEGGFVLDFRYIYLLAEHKKEMLKKIKFILEINIDPRGRSIYEEYEKIYKDYIIIKNVFLKNVLKDNGFGNIYGQLKDKKTIAKLYDRLLLLHSKEEVVLEEFISAVSVLELNAK